MASFSVVSNIASTNAQANLSVSTTGLNKALNRLSSGFRINTSGDDAAGLAIANNYRSEQAILTQGIRNANDGLSVLNIKDGALNNVSLLIDRLATLASQASSDAGNVDLSKLEDEYTEVIDEIDREHGRRPRTRPASRCS
jgi:flagellin